MLFRENASLVYITSLSVETALLLPIITRFAQQHNIPIATNPGSSQLKEHAASLRDCLNALDILILNAQEAAQLLSTITPDQPFDLTRYMKTILGKGVRIVAVTKDIDGVWVAYNDTLYYHPSISVEIASTIGAGDAFGSAFTASIAQNYSIEESLVRGIINASSVIGSYDAKSGLLSKKELDDRMKKLGTSNISKPSLKNR